jgi:uncharacterized membrane protein
MKNISKIKLNLVTEKLYVEGIVNKLYEDIANYGEGDVKANTLMESILKEENNKSIIGDIVDDFKLAPKFIFTFGTGIGAFYGPIQKLLEGSGVVISEYEIYLLIVTAIATLMNESDSSLLVKTLKEKGLYSSLKDVMEYIKNSKKVINSVTKNVLGTTYSLSDILGFTALLVPTMNLMSDIINDYGITSNTLGTMLKGVILSTSVYGVKSIVKRIKNKIN